MYYFLFSLVLIALKTATDQNKINPNFIKFGFSNGTDFYFETPIIYTLKQIIICHNKKNRQRITNPARTEN